MTADAPSSPAAEPQLYGPAAEPHPSGPLAELHPSGPLARAAATGPARARAPRHPHVRIVMATRNGAAHLAEQLASLAAQSHGDWSLLVSDDGSQDATPRLVAEFAAAWPGREIRLIPGPCRGSAASNFLTALAGDLPPPGACLALSDQDDIWLPHRLERALGQLEAAASAWSGPDPAAGAGEQAREQARGRAWSGPGPGPEAVPDTATDTVPDAAPDAAAGSDHGLATGPDASPGALAPAIYASRTLICDAQGRVLKASRRHPRGASFGNALVQNILAGNTMVLNPAAAALVRRTAPAALAARQGRGVGHHDWWIYALLTGVGAQVVIDELPGLHYRQHAANVIGAHHRLGGAAARFGMIRRGEYLDWMLGNLEALAAVSGLLTPPAARLSAGFRAWCGPGSAPGARPSLAQLRRAGLRRQTRAGDLALLLALRLSGRLSGHGRAGLASGPAA